MRLHSREIVPPDYARCEPASGIIEYRKEVGFRARRRANLFVILAVLLVVVTAVIFRMTYEPPFTENNLLFVLTLITLLAVYILFRYQRHLRGGIAPNIVSIDINQQVLNVGIADEQVQFRFEEVQEVLLNSKKRINNSGSIVPTRFSYSIVLWTTDDVYFPLMEPLWQIDVPIRLEYEQMARDMAHDIRDLIRQSLIISKSHQKSVGPSILVDELN